MVTEEEVRGGSQGGAHLPSGPRHGRSPKRSRVSRRTKRILTAVVAVVLIGAIAFSLWFFLFRKSSALGDIIWETAQLGTIQSKVQGEGNARAGASAAVTLSANCTILDVLVNTGDVVYEGQPLYTAQSPDAEAQVAAAEKAVNDQIAAIESLKKGVTTAEEALENAKKSLRDVQALTSQLTVKAPFAGKLLDAADISVGDDLAGGSTLATLVNDRRMKLSLYISYAYENDVYVGQAAQVSVPVLMYSGQGVVEEIHKVDFISPEGGVFFEVTVALDNPGTLTEKMEASAVMVSDAGIDIYPYGSGELKYYDTVTVTAAQSGKVTRVGNLRSYANVEKGEVLVRQSADTLNEQIEAMENAVKSAEDGVTAANQAVTDGEARLVELQDALAAAQLSLENFNATAPISGTVMSCTVSPGQEVASGTTVITITDTTNMVVEITVDDRNIPFVTPGMTVELSDWNGMTYMGTVTNIDMTGSEGGSMGMTSYPVTLSVENYDGSLLQGMWLTYSFVTSEVVDVVTVPIQCVKSIVDTEGNPHDVVFLKADSRPDNAIDFEPPEEDYYGGATYPTPEDGCWPVPVETGLNDRYNVEITSGLELGAEVFSAFMMTGAYA